MFMSIGRKKNKNKKRTNENDAGNPNIFCSQFGGRKDTEHCTSLKYAKKAARKFDLTPKEGYFYNFDEHRIVENTFFLNLVRTFFEQRKCQKLFVSTRKVINGR